MEDPDDLGDIEITPEMIRAGVDALRLFCPFDLAFPHGGEEDAVEAVLRHSLETQTLADMRLPSR